MTRLLACALLLSSIALLPAARAAEEDPKVIWEKIAPAFKPPVEFSKPDDKLRSPLLFNDGKPVQSAADWQKRRAEILERWHNVLGPWPKLIEKPMVEIVESTRRDNFMQHKVKFELAPKHMTTGYLLVPEGEGKRPAVLVVYYEPETGIGLKGELRDFAYQLAKRGFVTLSIGLGGSIYLPDRDKAELQPLSALAYVAANSYYVLASRPEVDAGRVGVVGHSYGGKWAMFASCLFDKFACSVWSDGGIVFDEKRGNVNYWEPWYLGYDGPKFRKAGIPSEQNPRTGAYKKMIAAGYDLHELHALMAPRPFLVSGGSEDPPARWGALNHTVAVNKLLGHENRVAMTNRPKHSPTPESNEQLYLFFEYFLKHAKSK